MVKVPITLVCACAFLAVLAACHQRRPVITEKEVAFLRTAEPGLSNSCLEKAQYSGISSINQLPVDKCFEMEAVRTWKGVWQTGLENSDFCPTSTPDCGASQFHGTYWLSLSHDMDNFVGFPPPTQGGRYVVEFVGRRTARPGHHGHEGLWDFQVVVDRFVGIHRIP